MNLTMPAFPAWVGALSQTSISSLVMSCSLKRSRSKRMSAAHWRGRTVFPGPRRKRPLLHDHALAGRTYVRFTDQRTLIGGIGYVRRAPESEVAAHAMSRQHAR